MTVAGTVTVRTHEASTSVLPDGVSTLFVGESLAMTASEREPGAGRFENTCDYRLRRDGLDVAVVADGTTIATDDGVRDGRVDPRRARRRAVLRPSLARGDPARPALAAAQARR